MNFVDIMMEKNYQWNNLLNVQANNIENNDSKHIIEYIDVNESDTLMIAMTKDNLLEKFKR